MSYTYVNNNILTYKVFIVIQIIGCSSPENSKYSRRAVNMFMHRQFAMVTTSFIV